VRVFVVAVISLARLLSLPLEVDSLALFSHFSLTFQNFKHTYTEKSGFVTATKLGTVNKFFVAAAKNFAAATKRFVDRTKHFVVVTKYFCYFFPCS